MRAKTDRRRHRLPPICHYVGTEPPPPLECKGRGPVLCFLSTPTLYSLCILGRDRLGGPFILVLGVPSRLFSGRAYETAVSICTQAGVGSCVLLLGFSALLRLSRPRRSSPIDPPSSRTETSHSFLGLARVVSPPGTHTHTHTRLLLLELGQDKVETLRDDARAHGVTIRERITRHRDRGYGTMEERNHGISGYIEVPQGIASLGGDLVPGAVQQSNELHASASLRPPALPSLDPLSTACPSTSHGCP